MAKNEPEPLSEQEKRVAIEMKQAQERIDAAEARKQAYADKANKEDKE